MTIETGIENAGAYIDTLDDTYPANGDDLEEGDNHIRGIKNCLLNTFPNIAGAVTPTHTELNLLDGLTAGTVTASKPVVVDANKDASSFRNIGVEGSILDANGNESVTITATASAVNEITVANAATGNKPAINQTGADDVGIDIEGVELHNGAITLGSMLLSSSGVGFGDEYISAYNEGTWTPYIQDTSFSNGEGQTYTTNTGRFIQIGSLVFFHFYISISSIGSLTVGDQAYIAFSNELPAPTSDYSGGCTITYATGLSTPALSNVTGAVFNLGSNGVIQLRSWDSTSGAGTFLITELGTTGVVHGHGFYILT